MADVPENIPQQPAGQASPSENVLGQIPFANRAPNSKDKGVFWVWDKGSDSVLYVRSKISGSWYAQK